MINSADKILNVYVFGAGSIAEQEERNKKIEKYIKEGYKINIYSYEILENFKLDFSRSGKFDEKIVEKNNIKEYTYNTKEVNKKNGNITLIRKAAYAKKPKKDWKYFNGKFVINSDLDLNKSRELIMKEFHKDYLNNKENKINLFIDGMEGASIYKRENGEIINNIKDYLDIISDEEKNNLYLRMEGNKTTIESKNKNDFIKETIKKAHLENKINQYNPERTGFKARIKQNGNLENFNNLCYFNSIFQMLVASPYFRDIINKIGKEVVKPEFKTTNLITDQEKEFLRFFYYYNTAILNQPNGIPNLKNIPNDIISIEEFAKLCRMEEGQQQDSHEFFSFLIGNGLEEILKKINIEIIRPLEDINQFSDLRNKNKTTTKKEEHYYFSREINNNLQNTLGESEEIEFDIYKSGKNIKCNKETKYISKDKDKLLFIKRTSFEKQKDIEIEIDGIKETIRGEIVGSKNLKELDFKDFKMKPFYVKKGESEVKENCYISSFNCHYGLTLSGGHYVTFVRVGTNKKTNETIWASFDDTRETRIITEDVAKKEFSTNCTFINYLNAKDLEENIKITKNRFNRELLNQINLLENKEQIEEQIKQSRIKKDKSFIIDGEEINIEEQIKALREFEKKKEEEKRILQKYKEEEQKEIKEQIEKDRKLAERFQNEEIKKLKDKLEKNNNKSEKSYSLISLKNSSKIEHETTEKEDSKYSSSIKSISSNKSNCNSESSKSENIKIKKLKEKKIKNSPQKEQNIKTQTAEEYYKTEPITKTDNKTKNIIILVTVIAMLVLIAGIFVYQNQNQPKTTTDSSLNLNNLNNQKTIQTLN